jgi:hypothetical protein
MRAVEKMEENRTDEDVCQGGHLQPNRRHGACGMENGTAGGDVLASQKLRTALQAVSFVRTSSGALGSGLYAKLCESHHVTVNGIEPCKPCLRDLNAEWGQSPDLKGGTANSSAPRG